MKHTTCSGCGNEIIRRSGRWYGHGAEGVKVCRRIGLGPDAA